MQTNKLIPVAEPDIGELEEKFLLDAFRSGWISSIGEYISRFEREFANFCNCKHAVAVSNGTVAIQLALLASGIGAGDEVIVPALTFAATAAAVKHVGATPIFVDSDPLIGTLDLRHVENSITSLTKAIIPVHLYGHPADMDQILNIANKYGLIVIEDAAEAHGAKYKNRIVGSMGDMSTFSFYGNKLITTGEGGMIVTNNSVYAEKIRFLKDHAMEKNRRYWHNDVGYNFRMTNLQAAIGCAQLSRFQEILAKRERVLNDYKRAAAKNPKIVINPFLPYATPVPWLVSAILPHNTNCKFRDALIDHLRIHGVDSRPYFYPLPLMPPYKNTNRYKDNDFSNAMQLSDRGLSLPSSTSLDTKSINEIVDKILAFLD